MRTDAEKAAFRLRMKDFSRRVKAMTPDEREALADRLGIVTCEGHPLSPCNMAMLYYQTAPGEATPTVVAGYRQWTRAGRNVVKGQHARGYIWVPTGRRQDTDGEDDAPDSTRFVLVPMFDVTQTAELGEPVPA